MGSFLATADTDQAITIGVVTALKYVASILSLAYIYLGREPSKRLGVH
jgi:hypothetical protein